MTVIPHLLNDLSIMDCHGLTSFCHGIQYLTAIEIMNTPNFRKLGFLDKEDDNDTVKQFQGLRSLRTIPKNCINSKVHLSLEGASTCYHSGNSRNW